MVKGPRSQKNGSADGFRDPSPAMGGTKVPAECRDYSGQGNWARKGFGPDVVFGAMSQRGEWKSAIVPIWPKSGQSHYFNKVPEIPMRWPLPLLKGPDKVEPLHPVAPTSSRRNMEIGIRSNKACMGRKAQFRGFQGKLGNRILTMNF